MELLTLLLTILNTILIVLLGLKYFKDNYTIVSIQDWNTLANFYNDHVDEYDEDGKPIKEEKAGGFGFASYLEEEPEEDFEEDDDELDAESFMKMQCENCKHYCPYCGKCSLGE